jgi:hypothetical protein
MEHAELPAIIMRKRENVDPYVYLEELFDFAHLPELQQMLHEWFETTITDGWQSKSSSEREDIVYFFRKIEGLLINAHVINHDRLEAKRLFQ